MFRLLTCLMLMHSLFSFASGVLISGNSFDTTNPNFQENLALLPHSFSTVESNALAGYSLNGYDVVWLDGFSSYEGLTAAKFTSFIQSGGTLLVQNPGFGGNPVADYPEAGALSSTYVEEGFAQVSIVNSGTFVTEGLDDAALSNWAPASAVGYFTQIGDFTGLSTNGTANQWVTLIKNVGQGRILYTHQLIAQTLHAGVLNANAGPLRFLDNILRAFPPVTLTPPTFAQTAPFWRDASGLHGLLPHPNNDGIDASGELGMFYKLTLQVDGVRVWGPSFVSGTWPLQVDISPDQLPNEPYYISLSRAATGSDDSEPIQINGPRAAATDPGILLRYRRWLMHVPRRAGGFSAVVRVQNTSPSVSVETHLVAYSSEGNELGTEVVSLSGGQHKDLDLYGSDPQSIFVAPQFLDQISHIAIWDEAHLSRVSLRYVADISGFGVWAQEVDLGADLISGQRFRLDGSSPSTAYYDGVALLNLSTSLTPRIVIHRFNEHGSTAGEADLGLLAPGAKALRALSFIFDTYEPNASYEIEVVSDSDSARIQVFGLSGSTSGDFFATANVTRLE